MYQFHYKNLWADVVELGDYHGVEIYFIFDTYGLPGMELLHPFLVGEKAMVEVMQGYWAGMAKQQRPKYVRASAKRESEAAQKDHQRHQGCCRSGARAKKSETTKNTHLRQKRVTGGVWGGDPPNPPHGRRGCTMGAPN
jgi:carboxylesterase type B